MKLFCTIYEKMERIYADNESYSVAVSQKDCEIEQHKIGHYLKGAILGALGFCTRWAVDDQGVGPEWIEVVEIDLQLQSVYNGLHGIRMAHISDLHHGRTVSGNYLRRCIERINLLNVDLVLLTGDYITYDIRGIYRDKVAALLGEIESRFGTYACLGNHDYGIWGSHFTKRLRNGVPRNIPGYKPERRFYQLIEAMESRGITVLRNESIALNINGHPLYFVGLGDLLTGDFHPHKAFANVPSDQVVIALVHNPRGIEHLGEFPADAVVSGHTHGRKTRPITSREWGNGHRRFHSGLYEVEGKKLYVNRGLGRVGRARLNTRPEITVFTLR
jgi:predicted MPP superfamily phosphohydrolase